MKQFDESLKQIATALKNGELAIFIGADLSASVGFPTANELLQLLFQKDPNREHLNPKVESLASAADWCSANKDVAWLCDFRHEKYPEGEAEYLYFLGLAYDKISDSVAAKASYRKACTCDSSMGNSVWKSKAAKKLEELSPK